MCISFQKILRTYEAQIALSCALSPCLDICVVDLS